MGAGIVPVAKHNGQLYFLFGKEVYGKKWSDFGGSSNKSESLFDTALREGYEETDGFLGTKQELWTLVQKNLLGTIEQKNGYKSYLFQIPYDSKLPTYFNAHHITKIC